MDRAGTGGFRIYSLFGVEELKLAIGKWGRGAVEWAYLLCCTVLRCM